MTPRERNPLLDGLRGLAVSLVVAYHLIPWLPPFAESALSLGWSGVDLFFCLSGFLITRNLLGTLGDSDYWSRFVSRRARRILPVYLVVLSCAAILRWVGVDEEAAAPWWSYLTFTSNFWQSAFGLGTPLLMVTWSLACEEQFYAVWPLVVRWFSRSGLSVLCGVLLLAAPALRWAFEGTMASYVLLPMRVDAMAAGALLAVGGVRSRSLAVWALLAVLLADQHSVFAVVSAWLVRAAEARSLEWLSWAPLRRLGTVSFCLYLVHFPLAHFLGPVAGIPLALVVSLLSWKFLEEPVLRIWSADCSSPLPEVGLSS